MAITVNATAILFSDGSTQTTAITQKYLGDSAACTTGYSLISIPGDGISYQTNTAWWQTKLSVGTTTADDLFFKSDGTKMYVLDSGPDQVLQFNLSTAWEIDTASLAYSGSSIATFGGSGLGGMTNAYGMAISSDGTKLYLTNKAGTSSKIVQYTLSTPWEINTATISISANIVIGVTPGEQAPTGIRFKSDGTKMYYVGQTLKKVHEYNLSTPWVVNTASATLVGNVAVSSTGQQGVEFNNTGSTMYIPDYNTDFIYEYSLSTPWSVNTATLTTNIDISSTSYRTPTAGNNSGISYSANGHKMYISDFTTNDVRQYTFENNPSLKTVQVGGDLVISTNSTCILIG